MVSRVLRAPPSRLCLTLRTRRLDTSNSSAPTRSAILLLPVTRGATPVFDVELMRDLVSRLRGRLSPQDLACLADVASGGLDERRA